MPIVAGNPNQDLIGLVEIELGHRIDTDYWAGGGSYYWILHPDGEVVRVEVQGVAYTKAACADDCWTTPSTWYQGTDSPELYLHMDDGGNPGASGHIIMAFFWAYIATEHIDPDGTTYKDGVKYTPASWNGHRYKNLMTKDNMPPVNYSTGGYHEGGTRRGFGALKFNAGKRDGVYYFDTALSLYVWEGKKALQKIGKRGDSYSDYIAYHPARTSDIEWDNQFVTINTEDWRT